MFLALFNPPCVFPLYGDDPFALAPSILRLIPVNVALSSTLSILHPRPHRSSLTRLEEDLKPSKEKSSFSLITIFGYIFRSELWVAFEVLVLMAWALFLLIPDTQDKFKEMLGTDADNRKEYIHSVQVITCVLFILESIVVNTVEGLGFRVSNTLDLFLCVLLPFLVFLTVNEIFFPVTALRVITLIPRSPFCYRQGRLAIYRLTHMGMDYSLEDEDDYIKSEHGETPSDIPMLRLVQLLKRTIKGNNSIYNLEEREELKVLLLQIIHHKIYTSTLPNKKNFLNTHEEKEVQKIKNIYTLGKYQSNKTLKPR